MKTVTKCPNLSILRGLPTYIFYCEFGIYLVKRRNLLTNQRHRYKYQMFIESSHHPDILMLLNSNNFQIWPISVLKFR